MDVYLKTVLVHASSPEKYGRLLASAKTKKRFTVKRVARGGVSFSVTGELSRLDRWLDRLSATVDTRPLFQPRLLHAAAAAAAVKPSVSPIFTCTEYASIYNFPAPPSLPPGSDPVVISVISFGGGLFGTATPNNADGLLYITSGDVQAHWQGLGIAEANMPRVAIKLLPGATNDPAGDIASTGENTLDVEMIGACYPSSNLLIVLFIAPNTFAGFVDVLTAATSGIDVAGLSAPVRPSVVSVSWGAPETAFGSSMANAISSIMHTAVKAGINICCATGDNGANDGTRSLCCDFPSSSPYAVACGGTSLKCPTRIRGHASTVETAWTGTGGGVSRVFAKPSHQGSLAGKNRQTPDVAMNADPSTGVWFTINGAAVQLGGTSIVSPAFSAWIALTRTKVFVTPMLYTPAFKPAYYDIVAGSNGGYRAAIGFDNCSGLGSINGTALAALMQTNVTVESIAVTAASAVIGTPNRVTVTLSATLLPSTASSAALTWSTGNVSGVSISTLSSTLVANLTITNTSANTNTRFVASAADALFAATGSLGVATSTSRVTLVLAAASGRDVKALLPALAGITTYLALKSSVSSLVVSSAFGLSVAAGTRRGRPPATVSAIGLSAQGTVIIATVVVTLK